jgi:CRP-like cAMP-binding protein
MQPCGLPADLAAIALGRDAATVAPKGGWNWTARRWRSTPGLIRRAASLEEQQMAYDTLLRARGSADMSFIGALDRTQVSELVRFGYLAACRSNAVICRSGARDDTMYVVLRGVVGAYPAADDRTSGPAFVLQEGEVFGERALLLSTAHSGNMVAMSDTTLLAFDMRSISKLPSEALDRVTAHMTSRALIHLRELLPFFVDHDRPDPVAQDASSEWNPLAALASSSTLISVPSHHRRLDVTTVTAARAQAGPGIYILLAGALQNERAKPTRATSRPGSMDNSHKPTVLSGEQRPLLWVDLPGVAVLPRRTFEIQAGPVRLLYLGAEGLASLPARERQSFYRRIRQASSSCFEYDAVMLSHPGGETAGHRLTAALIAAGLNVLHVTAGNTEELDSELICAIRESRALVPIMSRDVDSEGWMQKAIDIHRHYFDESRMYPVILDEGQHYPMISGFRPIQFEVDETTALKELASELGDLHASSIGPPLSYAAKDDLLVHPPTWQQPVSSDRS